MGKERKRFEEWCVLDRDLFWCLSSLNIIIKLRRHEAEGQGFALVKLQKKDSVLGDDQWRARLFLYWLEIRIREIDDLAKGKSKYALFSEMVLVIARLMELPDKTPLNVQTGGQLVQWSEENLLAPFRGLVSEQGLSIEQTDQLCDRLTQLYSQLSRIVPRDSHNVLWWVDGEPFEKLRAWYDEHELACVGGLS